MSDPKKHPAPPSVGQASSVKAPATGSTVSPKQQQQKKAAGGSDIDHRKERLRQASRESDDEDDGIQFPKTDYYTYDNETKKDDKDNNNDENKEGVVESTIQPELAGVYAALFKTECTRQLESSIVVPLPPRIIGGVRDQAERVKSCQCQKSSCLKLYCKCFSSGIHCSSYCDCNDCFNDGASNHQYFRNKAILICLERNRNSFRPGQADTTISEKEEEEGGKNKREAPCSCTKSRCLKVRRLWQCTFANENAWLLLLYCCNHSHHHHQSLDNSTPQKYCHCFGVGIYCKQYCKCAQCYNYKGNPEREKLTLYAQRLATSETSKSKAGAKAAKAKAAVIKTPATNAKTITPEDDGDLPPSYYAVPMRLPGGIDSASLSFGLASLGSKKRKAESSPGVNEAVERAMATEEAILERRNQVDSRRSPHGTSHAPRNFFSTPSSSRPKTQGAIQTELEHKWAIETQDVLGTFQAMRQELLQRKKDAGLLGGADIEISREYSYYDLVGSAQLAAVELDLAEVMTSVKEAEAGARRVAQQEQQQQSTPAKSSDPDEQMLLCDETVDKLPRVSAAPCSAPRMDSTKREELTVELAQDAALMRELARIIRRHAQEMKEARTSNHPLY
ncbi:lin-54 homolog [Seminavis robusta]|uniref:Lin-54 homolog n=1 Tax=Seminavis robusta TaxID=568900 RepID=A0A9N8E7R5_9STRA|nr:lin-54 homolog [Seminavis robusta]|eukprot:Sro773_g200530.1 lin-54 homolog (619) ;mRNA; f:39650-41635